MIAIAQRYALLALLTLVPLLGLTAWGFHKQAARAEAQLAEKVSAYERLEGLLADQKREAATTLDVERGKTEDAERKLAVFQQHQKETDDQNQKTVADLRARVLAERAARLRDRTEAAGRGAGGGGAEGAGAAGTGGGAGGATDAAGLLPATTAGEDGAADDAFIADRINLAFISCRADALKVREVLAPAP